jgi:hypothetical protein
VTVITIEVPPMYTPRLYATASGYSIVSAGIVLSGLWLYTL